jgi:hypothetical protein
MASNIQWQVSSGDLANVSRRRLMLLSSRTLLTRSVRVSSLYPLWMAVYKCFQAYEQQ